MSSLIDMMRPYQVMLDMAMSQTMRMIILEGRRKHRRKVLKEAYNYESSKRDNNKRFTR